MKPRAWGMLKLWALQLALCGLALASSQAQHQLDSDLGMTASSTVAGTISTALFATLERLARLVDIAYCIGTTGVDKPFECVSRCSDFPTLSLITTWNTGVLLSDSCGFVAVDHGVKQQDTVADESIYTAGRPAIIVAFRGTYSITNTVVDLSTVPQKYVPYPSPDNGGEDPPQQPEHECTNCTVHMGFLESWKNARPLVIPALQQLKAQYPSFPIQLIGHSLGGAVACLAALELKVSLGWEDVVVTTFGEPRVGNPGLARFVDEVFHLNGQDDLEKRSYRRVTHQEDPVPLLPLGEWGYQSHAGEIFISKKDLSPSEEDVHLCIGDHDPECISKGDDNIWESLRHLPRLRNAAAASNGAIITELFPSRLKLWQLFFAHRDYFWRLGLCVPGGDPANWGRNPYGSPGSDEL
ncbi:Alpha/Beta hydrolase protein [Dactylonectria macrodidyma]|uniref:Alpha/Beta hydrolase protein n=1 Tax=Dactylonectria macrodidyma TaxID=307937 RepID=A0A9P9IV67_9HYPO|nr:Alpha/Beta hydrolase protein [Dactylonectria macrodidyma]